MIAVETPTLRAPFPWFGGKSRASALIWQRFGDVRNYVEPFAGSLAVLLGRPHAPGTETINDLDCFVANFWRAVSADPVSVAAYADAPVNEADLHARHTWLVSQVDFRECMKLDPHFYDVKIAGWWVWGLSCWIGGGWCAERKRGVERKRPIVAADRAGNGVHGKMPGLHPKGLGGVQSKMPLVHPNGNRGCQTKRQIPNVNPLGLKGVVGRQLPRIDAQGNYGALQPGRLDYWFSELCARLRETRVVCGDWTRVLGPTPLGLTDNVPPGFRTAVLLDPPYCSTVRDPEIYRVEATTLSAEVRAWSVDHGADPRLRIALCGYEGEHEMPSEWECVAWKANGGYGNRAGNGNAKLERIWFSPHCLKPIDSQGDLFE